MQHPLCTRKPTADKLNCDGCAFCLPQLRQGLRAMGPWGHEVRGGQGETKLRIADEFRVLPHWDAEDVKRHSCHILANSPTTQEPSIWADHHHLVPVVTAFRSNCTYCGSLYARCGEPRISLHTVSTDHSDNPWPASFQVSTPNQDFLGPAWLA